MAARHFSRPGSGGGFQRSTSRDPPGPVEGSEPQERRPATLAPTHEPFCAPASQRRRRNQLRGNPISAARSSRRKTAAATGTLAAATDGGSDVDVLAAMRSRLMRTIAVKDVAPRDLAALVSRLLDTEPTKTYVPVNADRPGTPPLAAPSGATKHSRPQPSHVAIAAPDAGRRASTDALQSGWYTPDMEEAWGARETAKWGVHRAPSQYRSLPPVVGSHPAGAFI